MDTYAVIGNPVSHSKSPIIHRLFAQQCQHELEYTTLLSEEKNFEHDVKIFFQTGKGLNVTVPFKIQAMRFSDQLSVTAYQAGAVNTLIKQTDGSIFGDNTDGEGLVIDLLHNLNVDLEGKSIVIVGAGGATQGVIYPLLAQHCKDIRVANRTLEKAQVLSEHFSSFGSVTAISLEELANIDSVDVLINASSAGLSGESPALPNNLTNTFCYDMIYGKTMTPFLSAAVASGCKQYADGLGMLVEQAAQSFFLWRGIKPETTSVLKVLKAEL